METLQVLRQRALDALLALAVAETNQDIRGLAQMSFLDLEWFIAGHSSACPMNCAAQHLAAEVTK